MDMDDSLEMDMTVAFDNTVAEQQSASDITARRIPPRVTSKKAHALKSNTASRQCKIFTLRNDNEHAFVAPRIARHPKAIMGKLGRVLHDC